MRSASLSYFPNCGSERTRTYELVRGRIYSPLQLPLCDTPNDLKSIFLIYGCYLYVFLASAALVAEQTFCVQTFYFKKFLSATRAYRKPVAVASVCLVSVFLCNYVHIGALSPQN